MTHTLCTLCHETLAANGQCPHCDQACTDLRGYCARCDLADEAHPIATTIAAA